MKKVKNIGTWGLENGYNISVGNFNNVTDVEKFGTCPGKFDNSAYKIENPDATLETIPYNESDFAFKFLSDNYFYGIKNDKTEIIGVCDGKNITPIFKGAGNMWLRSTRAVTLLEITGITDYSVNEIDGYTTVTVNYEADGEFKLIEELSNTYTFKENGIFVHSETKCRGLGDGLYLAGFKRNYYNPAKRTTNRMAYNWIYPENNDFPHPELEALCIAQEFGDTVTTTFMHCNPRESMFDFSFDFTERLPVNIPRNATEIDYPYDICLVFQPKAVENQSYKALFMGKDMKFAAGVASVEDNKNSTFFMGRDLNLNINVTNISSSELNYSVRYNIMDHYNNEVDEGIFYNNVLQAGEVANRNIKLSLEKYGMYYLNLYVTDGAKEYREYYSFAMLEEFDFKHKEENPLGICGTHHETYEQGMATLELLKKIGLPMVRLGRSYDNKDFITHFKDYGITRYSAGTGWCRDEAGIQKFEKELKATCDEFSDCSYFLMANEVDSPYKANYDTSKNFLEKTYIPYTYDVAYKYISENHPHLLDKTIWQSNCHGTTEWLEAFYETGMWDNSPIIDIHSYSSPSGPDKVFSNQYDSMYANTYSQEYAMIRWKRITRRYGPKDMMVGETGFPTTPAYGDTAEIDIRTQADFNTRIAFFFLEAGAKEITYYCLLDRTSLRVGVSGWNEMNFGAVYDCDYYGVYMPKPWAAALATLTRQLDGIKACTHNEKYEEDEHGTLRAFDVEKADGKMTVLWSNIYLQPNTTAPGRMNKVQREPMPTWVDRWVETETRSFDAVSDKVRVVDVMGNETILIPKDGKVDITVSGSPIFVYGI